MTESEALKQEVDQLKLQVWGLKKRLIEFERLHAELQDGIEFLKSVLGD